MEEEEEEEVEEGESENEYIKVAKHSIKYSLNKYQRRRPNETNFDSKLWSSTLKFRTRKTKIVTIKTIKDSRESWNPGEP